MMYLYSLILNIMNIKTSTMKKSIFIMILAIISLTAKAQYCTTNLYSVGCYSATLGNFRIDSLKFGSINVPNPSCNTTAGQLGYTDLTTVSTTLIRGYTYNLSYKIVSPVANNYIKAWIDTNNSITFDPTEVVHQQNNIPQGYYSQNINLPINTPVGTYRMRIRLVSGNSFTGACDTATKGECIDFIVNVVHNYDVGIDSIILPKDTSLINTYVYPKFKIHNYGEAINSMPFNIYGTVDQPVAMGTYFVISFNGTLAANASTYITSMQVVTTRAFNICFYTSLPGDINHLNDTLCKHITIDSTFNYDVGVSAITSPNTPVYNGSILYPTITIRNYGNGTCSNIPVKLSINNVVVDSGIYTSALGFNSTASYTFTNPITAPNSNFTLCAYTTYNGDNDTVNDKNCANIIVDTVIHNDVGISSILSPNSTVIQGSNISLTVSIKNYGNAVINNIPIKYSVNNVLIDSTICTNNISIGSDYMFTFPYQIVVPFAYNFKLCVYTYLNGDGNSSNNNLCEQLYAVVGINNYTNHPSSSIKIYPNPAINKLNVEYNYFKKGITKFSIYNIQGAKLYNDEEYINTDTYNKIIDVGNLKAGIYFIKLENEEGIYNAKFVKN